MMYVGCFLMPGDAKAHVMWAAVQSRLRCEASGGNGRGDRPGPLSSQPRSGLWGQLPQAAQTLFPAASGRCFPERRARAPYLLSLEVPYPFIPANTYTYY